MKTSIIKAIELILSLDAELLNILSVTAQMSLQSSVLALLIGLPIGIWLGACKFPGRNVLLVANRTLMGMPPVVCGLVFYMLFSGVGPFRHLRLLFTVDIMIMAQVVLITPIVIGTMETYIAGIAPSVRETAKGLGLGGFKTFGLLCNVSERAPGDAFDQRPLGLSTLESTMSKVFLAISAYSALPVAMESWPKAMTAKV